MYTLWKNISDTEGKFSKKNYPLEQSGLSYFRSSDNNILFTISDFRLFSCSRLLPEGLNIIISLVT